LTGDARRCSVARVSVAEFMLLLATDRDLMLRYLQNPAEVARENGIGPDDFELLRSGKLKDIRLRVTVDIEVGEIVAFQTVHGTTVHVEPPPEGS
jgi:hypothetical protein